MIRYIPDSDDDDYAPQNTASSKLKSSSTVQTTNNTTIEETPEGPVQQIEPTPDLPSIRLPSTIPASTSPKNLKRKRASPLAVKDSQLTASATTTEVTQHVNHSPDYYVVAPASTSSVSKKTKKKAKTRVKTKWEASSSEDELVARQSLADQSRETPVETISAKDEVAIPTTSSQTTDIVAKTSGKVKKETKKGRQAKKGTPSIIEEAVDILESDPPILDPPEPDIIEVNEVPLPPADPSPTLSERNASSSNITKNFAASKPLCIRPGPRPRVGLSRKQRVDPLHSIRKL